jgi:hypothetical protein
VSAAAPFVARRRSYLDKAHSGTLLTLECVNNTLQIQTSPPGSRQRLNVPLWFRLCSLG